MNAPAVVPLLKSVSERCGSGNPQVEKGYQRELRDGKSDTWLGIN
jgi:hypothetical protein